MSRKLPKKDVVIIGLGWTGSIMANELTDEGLDVIAIERGPWRDAPTEFPTNYVQDELRYRIRHELFLRPEQKTFTFRNKMDQTALPIRDWGSFMPPNGVGGGGVHWNAETWRFLPTDFVLRTHLTERYGAAFLPEDMTIQDFGVTYDDLEPHYDAFEYLCGTSGTAGNLRGQIQEGGNPFEGPRSRPYPTPAQKQPFSHTLFAKAARELGYKPFPQPSGNLSQAYKNPLGLQMGPCTYCGFCEWFGCGNYSKASPQTTILPHLIRKSNFTARDNSEVIRIDLDRSGKRATGVTFVDTSGVEWEQPADLVILAAYTMFNVQMLLHSKIGAPYDPVANKGVIGRNFTHQTISSVNGFFDNNEVQFQSVHRVGFDRHVHRRIQRRQFRSRPGRLRRRRLHGAGADRRPADPDHARTSGHAEMGRPMEERGARQLSLHRHARHRRARQLLQLPRRLSGSRPHLQGPLRPSDDADDDRFSRQRDEAECLPDRQIRRDHPRHGRPYPRQDVSQGALRRDRLPDHASERRRDHGDRSHYQCDQPLSCRVGTCRTCSSRAPARSRKTPATTRPAPWRRWRSGRRRRSANNI